VRGIHGPSPARGCHGLVCADNLGMGPTTHKGNQSLAAIVSALAARGVHVFLPFGEGYDADLVISIDDRLVSLQVKSGRIRSGAILFQTTSVMAGPNRKRIRDYRGVVDMFAVYCADNDQTYLVPVDDVPVGVATIRVEAAKNRQRRLVRWADAYLLDDVLDSIRSKAVVAQ
jgi:hypothetical protein